MLHFALPQWNTELSFNWNCCLMHFNLKTWILQKILWVLHILFTKFIFGKYYSHDTEMLPTQEMTPKILMTWRFQDTLSDLMLPCTKFQNKHLFKYFSSSKIILSIHENPSINGTFMIDKHCNNSGSGVMHLIDPCLLLNNEWYPF